MDVEIRGSRKIVVNLDCYFPCLSNKKEVDVVKGEIVILAYYTVHLIRENENLV